MPIEPAELQHFLEPSFLDGLDAKSMEDVRALRTEVQDAELAVSYVRRLVQGRVDIIEAERRRRSGDPTGTDGAGSGGTSGGSSEGEGIVENLPGILADAGRSPGPGRLPMHIDPGEQAAVLVAELDREVDPNELVDLGTRSDDELEQVVGSLRAIERQLSGQRHALHERLDALQAEMVRRYRSGEATVDTLLP